ILVGSDRHARGVEHRPMALQLVDRCLVDSQLVQNSRDILIGCDRTVIDLKEKVSLLHSGASSGTIRSNRSRLDSRVGLDPEASVLWHHIEALLLDIETAQDQQTQGDNSRCDEFEGTKPS